MKPDELEKPYCGFRITSSVHGFENLAVSEPKSNAARRVADNWKINEKKTRLMEQTGQSTLASLPIGLKRHMKRKVEDEVFCEGAE
ncbi:hypothetical protein WUBG_06855, partial [Wuchereria bancrofti]